MADAAMDKILFIYSMCLLSTSECFITNDSFLSPSEACIWPLGPFCSCREPKGTCKFYNPHAHGPRVNDYITRDVPYLEKGQSMEYNLCSRTPGRTRVCLTFHLKLNLCLVSSLSLCYIPHIP